MIDDTDLQILEQLRKDGRKSYSNIADELNIATSTVTARIQKMKDNNIITGFKPEINYENLGFEITAMIAIKAKAEKIEETAQQLESNKKAISFFEVTGNTDMIVISRFINRKDMNNFLKQLQQTPGIQSTETNIILTTPKIDDNINLTKLTQENKNKLNL